MRGVCAWVFAVIIREGLTGRPVASDDEGMTGDIGRREEMADVVALPPPTDAFPDARGADRWMRVTWHHEADVVVLSVWRSQTCIATMRVGRADVPALVQSLVAGLALPSEPTVPHVPKPASPATRDRGRPHPG
jgi:hypothetical protein